MLLLIKSNKEDRVKFKMFAWLLALSAIVVCRAEVKLPAVFSNDMVLQHAAKLPVWGTAEAGETVTVEVAGQTVTATADATGKWKLTLEPLAAGGPIEMTVKGSKSNTQTLTNILVGEVWVCSGQSNMQWSFKNVVQDKEKHLAAANHPKIRLFNIPRRIHSSPQTDVANTTWKVCDSKTVEDFSAVGYFFGLELFNELKVPVGLINSSWGGTRIEPWTPVIGFKDIPTLKSIWDLVELQTPGTPAHDQKVKAMLESYKVWLADAQTRVEAKLVPVPAPAYPKELVPFNSNAQPTTLYNGMINPVVPFAVRGAIWYQGEANLSDGMLYYDKMKALVNGWRSVWSNPDMAFYFVQLAPYRYGNTYMLPVIWQAQEKFAKDMPNTGMAVINDIGNPKDIHPANKHDVGKRLALQALNKTYGKKELVADSPTLKSMEIKGKEILLTFNTKALKTRDGKQPDWFEICGPNGNFVKADAQITNNTVTLSAEEVETPLAMRYAWSGIAEPNLTGETGLPVGAFQAGTPPDADALLKNIVETEKYQIVYSLDPTNSKVLNNGRAIQYTVDDSAKFAGKKIKRLGYFMGLTTKAGDMSYVFVSLDPFTQDIKKIAVPMADTQAVFQQKVANLNVKSNVEGVATGTVPEGNIEFWPNNYGVGNAANIPGAANNLYDFGDVINTQSQVGYGSMQIHNYAASQTIFAFNNFRSGKNADVGIGNQPAGAQKHPDWTFSKSAQGYDKGILAVLVQLDE